jgi:hypothetical protein
MLGTAVQKIVTNENVRPSLFGNDLMLEAAVQGSYTQIHKHTQNKIHKCSWHGASQGAKQGMKEARDKAKCKTRHKRSTRQGKAQDTLFIQH